MLRQALHWFAGTRPLRVIDAEVVGVNGNKIGEAPLFERYFLCEIPHWIPKLGGGAVYLHHYLRSDPDRGVHDHPWDHAIAVQLAGGYVEERFAGVSPEGLRKAYKARKPGAGYVQRGSDFHRVLVDGLESVQYGKPPTSWSLFAHGPYRKGWGFLSDAGCWQRLDAEPAVGLIFRPFKNENDGSSKWWKDREKHPRGDHQRRADAWGRRPAFKPVDLQHAARLAEDVQ